MQTMRHCFDKNFDKLEIYILKNIFHVPNDICLQYDAASASEAIASENEENAVDAEIMSLRKSIRRAQALKIGLETECKRASQRKKDALQCASAVRKLRDALSIDESDDGVRSLNVVFSELTTGVGELRRLESVMCGTFILRVCVCM